MQNVSENAGTITSESNECNTKTPVGVEKPWAEMSLEERDAADRKRGFNNEGDRIGGEGVDLGVDDHTTIIVFKLTKEDKVILHRLMVKYDHLLCTDTLSRLLREEAARIGELSCHCLTTNVTITQNHKNLNIRSLWQTLRKCLGVQNATSETR